MGDDVERVVRSQLWEIVNLAIGHGERAGGLHLLQAICKIGDILGDVLIASVLELIDVLIAHGVPLTRSVLTLSICHEIAIVPPTLKFQTAHLAGPQTFSLMRPRGQVVSLRRHHRDRISLVRIDQRSIKPLG